MHGLHKMAVPMHNCLQVIVTRMTALDNMEVKMQQLEADLFVAQVLQELQTAHGDLAADLLVQGSLMSALQRQPA